MKRIVSLIVASLFTIVASACSTDGPTSLKSLEAPSGSSRLAYACPSGWTGGLSSYTCDGGIVECDDSYAARDAGCGAGDISLCGGSEDPLLGCGWGYDPRVCWAYSVSTGTCNTPSGGGGGGGGGGGAYPTPTAHYDTVYTNDDGETNPDLEFAAPERINSHGFILKNQYVKNTEFTLQYEHDSHLHYFFVTSGLFARNPWGVSNRGADGWKGNYSLTIQDYITYIRSGTPGETLQWVTRIPIHSTLKPILGNPDEVIGGFVQKGQVAGSFIGIHYR